MDEHNTRGIKSSPYRNGKQAVEAAKTYLQENFAQAFTLDDLASLTGFNKHYLRTLFKQQTGLSPHVFQRQVRLEQAKQYLAKGLSAIETADLVGFADQSHLNRHFREQFGLTVGEYQQSSKT